MIRRKCFPTLPSTELHQSLNCATLVRLYEGVDGMPQIAAARGDVGGLRRRRPPKESAAILGQVPWRLQRLIFGFQHVQVVP
jgi:hypothetical protein